MNNFITQLLSKMSIDEKIGQLNLAAPGGDIQTGSLISEDVENKIRAGKIGAILNSPSFDAIVNLQELAVNESPNKIPLIFGLDVIHGYQTIFPIPLALSCSWDMELIERSAHIAATEASAAGICWTFSPMVDIARDPRWGRITEGAGEDAWLGSQVAKAMVRGYQGNDLSSENTIMACVKHFGMYGAAEAGREYSTTDMSRLQMYQDYLPPYKAGIDAGAGSIMTSFNTVDRIPATGNRWLLTEVLRDQWKFNGFVVTDYTAINEMTKHGVGDLKTVSGLAFKAGSEMDMVGEGFLKHLKILLDEGKITEEEINVACRHILEAKYKLGLFDDPYRYLKKDRLTKDIFTQKNIDASRESAVRSMVLLKNKNNILPLKESKTIAVIGPLADNKYDMLGSWAMSNHIQEIVTPLEGIKNAAGNRAKVLYAKGANITDDPYLSKHAKSIYELMQNAAKPSDPDKLLKETMKTAKKADVIIAVLGESGAMAGEAASRSDIGLPESQKNLLKALVKTGKMVILVLINGRPMTLEWETENVSAILEAWAPGTQAGNAIADVLFGKYNPSGKLTTTFPRNVGQIPIYYNQLNTGRPVNPEDKFTSKYIDVPNDPLYPFGFGISYTTLEYSEIELSSNEIKGNAELKASVIVKNTGSITGEEVVQLYINDPVASLSRPVKELKNFRKVMLQPDEEKKVEFTITTEDLKFYNSNLEYVWEPGEFIIYIGTNSRDVKSARVNWLK